MEKITARNVLYIKLGDRGRWEKDCLEKGYLKIGFRKASHSDCLKGDWDSISDFYLKKEWKSKRTASDFKRQIRSFYEEPSDTLWVTFADKKMWWCFAEKRVIQNEDGTKIRYVKKRYPWSDKDINGNILNEDNINGKLRSVQAYRQTICKVPNNDDVIRKINCDPPKNVIVAEEAKRKLEDALSHLIKDIQWQDFELLVDLIFRSAGWKRNIPIGGVNKLIDLDLTALITNERAAVQIKSVSTVKEFEEYAKKFDPTNYNKYFYFVNNDEDFQTYQNKTNIKLVLNRDITKYIIDAGLVDWVIQKAF